MPFTVTEFEATPNPNAIKCWLDKSISDGPRSFRDPAAAAGNPIAARLFAEAGATSVLLNGQWLTVNKTPETSWSTVKSAIRKVLKAQP